jgi:hypothetical protein
MRTIVSIAFVLMTAAACGGKPKPEPTPPDDPPTAAGPCYKGGCSGQLCVEEEGMVSTCEFRPEYACYRDATCERQADGACGWTPTEALTACLASPPAAE